MSYMKILKKIKHLATHNSFLIYLIIIGVLAISYFLARNHSFTSITEISSSIFGERKDAISLKNKYESFHNSLNKSKNYKKAYSMLAPSEKEKVSEEKFINGFVKRDSKANTGKLKGKRNINNIIITDNFGFIDETFCSGEDCDNKKMTRRYQKWIFVDKQWFIMKEFPKCIRNEPYPKSPEFERAISIIRQRFQPTNFAPVDNKDGIYNCVHIEYADLKAYGQGPEGVFYFDEQVSTPENLLIQVDYSYQVKDDLLTAILLMHELTHVNQFLARYFESTELGCVEDEVLAFTNEVALINVFNQEELNSLNARLNESQSVSYNPNLDGALQLAIIQTKSQLECQRKGLASNFDCFWDTVREKIKAMVISNPYYQKQCSL